MTYLFSQYWIFIALAFVLGLFVGWATRGGGPSSAGGWIGWAIAWFLAGLFVALFKWLPGLAGHLLEVALMLFAAFIIGCIAGCGARGSGSEGGSAAAHGHDGGAHGAPGAGAQAGAATSAPTHEDVLGLDSSASYPGARPAAAPAGAKADDLTRIAGVDSGTAKALGDIGVAQYGQIGGWGAPQTAWVEHHLAQPGRVGRENWIEQARNLASGKAPGSAAAAAAVGGIAAAASGAAGSAGPKAADGRTDATAAAQATHGAEPGSASGAAPARDGAGTGATASTSAAGAHASAQDAGAPASAGAVQPASGAGGTSTAAMSANLAGADAAPQPGMTDGQRSILAARQKMALKAQQAVAVAAVAATGATAASSVEAAPAAAPAATRAPTSAPRANMTDGQRSILAARQRMAEKAARTAGDAGAGGAAADATTGAAPAAAASGAQGAGDGRPAADASPNAPADDLKLIKGIGPKNEAALNALGVRRFPQIADWTPDNARWVGHSIKFPGRIEREHWIEQAKFLAAGVDTPHSAAVKSGAVKVDDSADEPMSEAEAAALAESLPQQAAKVENEQSYAGARPLGLAGPRGGKADDLKLIKGIGRQNEERLHALGVWHFDQIAAWSVENVKWIGSYLAFPGRIDREGWIAQAHELARGEKTEFAKRVEAGDVPSSKNLI